MPAPAYHRNGQMIPIDIRLTGAAESECFVLDLNHREYPMHTTEMVDLYEKSRAALVAWFQAMSPGEPEYCVGLNPELRPFAVMAGVLPVARGHGVMAGESDQNYERGG